MSSPHLGGHATQTRLFLQVTNCESVRSFNSLKVVHLKTFWNLLLIGVHYMWQEKILVFIFMHVILKVPKSAQLCRVQYSTRTKKKVKLHEFQSFTTFHGIEMSLKIIAVWKCTALKKKHNVHINLYKRCLDCKDFC